MEVNKSVRVCAQGGYLCIASICKLFVCEKFIVSSIVSTSTTVGREERRNVPWGSIKI